MIIHELTTTVPPDMQVPYSGPSSFVYLLQIDVTYEHFLSKFHVLWNERNSPFKCDFSFLWW
jgi:hypothetical protein